MFSLPQTILKQLLTTFAHTPERLSVDERTIASRICTCGHCDTFWVRQRTKLPDRCPHCSKRGWDRPFLNALLANQPTNTKHPAPQEQSAEEGGTN